MAALDYSAMASDLMSKGWSGSGRTPSDLMSNGWGGGSTKAASEMRTAGPQTQPPPDPQTQPAPPAGILSPWQGDPLMPAGGLMGGSIDRSVPVGPSTAPGVPVLPQEGGSMGDMFSSVLSALSGSDPVSGGAGIAGTGVPSLGASVPTVPPSNNFDSQLLRYPGGQQFGRP
jgi:hypothetical protein